MAYTKYSLTPANNNAAPPDGAPEGMLPSGVNDTMRDMMAQIRDVGDGIRDGTYTMTAPKITGGTITGVALTGNTFTSPVISGGSINNTPIGATTASTGAFSTLSVTGATTFSGATVANTFSSSGATITGGSVSGITDLAIADGGTGASTAANARVNLGVDNYGMLKNRIINGAMVIDQRNAGASGTNTGAFMVDRWYNNNSQSSKLTWQQNAGSVTPPIGFNFYQGITSSSAYSVVAGDYFFTEQSIEGFNFADLGWGTANAKTITISFWVQSSLTGTFGGALSNSAQNRSYPFSYTISAANTWEQKSVTIAGDTSGTWVGATNGIGCRVRFSYGAGSTFSGTAGAWAGSNFVSATGATSVVGTNGATFYITGVQLEVGTQATSFEYRQYQQELALCKRYYDKTFAINTAPAQNANRSGALETVATRAAGASGISSYFRFSVPMRATPSVTTYNPEAANAQARNLDTGGNCTSTTIDNMNEIGGKFIYTLPVSTVSTNLLSLHWSADAEL